MDNFLLRCPYCDSVAVIRRGKTSSKYREWEQRYWCKDCGRRFRDSPNARSRYPIWVDEAVLRLTAKAMKGKDIIDEIMKEGKLRKQEVKISVNSLANIRKRNVKILLRFEQTVNKKYFDLDHWMIDDTPQPSAEGDFEKLDGLYKKRKFFWITNVFQVKTRYWLSSYVSRARDNAASEISIKLALDCAKRPPAIVDCDGLVQHRRATVKILKVRATWKTKQEDYAHINIIERQQRTLRTYIGKKRSFRKLDSLQYLVEFSRLDYNFFHAHEALGGKTPANAVGIAYPSGGWKELINYAWLFARRRNKSTGESLDHFCA